MNIQERKVAREQLAKLGIVLKWNAEWQEWTANFKGGKVATAYHTGDMEDAIHTGFAMAKAK